VFVVETVEDDGALEHDHDGDADGLFRTFADVHFLAENGLEVGGLPDAGIHGLELADEALGETLDTEVDSEHVVVVGVEQVGADAHAQAQRSG